MIYFFKILWYKIFRLLEKTVKGGNKALNANNGVTFSLLLLTLNSIVIYFIISEYIGLDLNDSELRIVGIIYMGVLIYIGYWLILRNDKYKEIEIEISNSKYKGSYGNWIISLYIALTFILLIGAFIFKL